MTGMDGRAQGATVLLAPRHPGDPAGAGVPPVAPGASRTAGRTVAILIGLNLVIQIGLIVVILANDLGAIAAVRISLVTGVVFYAAAAMVVGALSGGLNLRPRIGDGHGFAGAAEGAVVGTGAAVVLSALLRLLLGRPQLDPTSGALAAGSVIWLVVGVLVVAVLAPVVEEFVFRGFLLEAFRDRGQVSAVVVSGVAFSLAHLSLVQFRYYLVMGMAFAVVYWRRGLIGSVAAHASFNGVLLLVAVVAMHAPVRQVSTAGFTVSLPAAWATRTDVSGDDLVGSSPVGTRVELAHVDGTRALDIDTLARDVARAGLPAPSKISVDPATVTRLALPAGRALTMAARIDGRDGRLVMVPKGNRLWLAALRIAPGDDPATAFDRILRSWHLP
jgi:membrane protease YdiL (CAAX protease family)